MDDILILLLGILWAAFSFYQSKEKKKKKAEEAKRVSQVSQSEEGQSYEDEGDIQEQAKSKGLFDTIFESLEERDQEANHPYNSREDSLSDEDISQQKEDVEAEKVRKAEDKLAEDKKQNQINNNRYYYRTRKNKKQKMVRNIVRNFDGKKAVIYTEILKRPQY
ncbi:MAG: hypothetical protein K9I29_02735 [Bacteroidales bacterium]|nr:hypothetical protein [Bacteroidales bacterium]MCF8327184.1 hypothetical protein [Bacteroidales bacterium]